MANGEQRRYIFDNDGDARTLGLLPLSGNVDETGLQYANQ